MELALECRGITKQFPGVLANDNIDFQLQTREIHAILGENGAGKSTLMNIFFGLQQPDSGKIFIKGKEVRLSHPAIAIEHGIGMVHQNLMLIPHLTVAENIVLGREPIRGNVWLNLDEAEGQIRDLSQKYSLEVDPLAHIEDLSLGVRQRVEILKALYRQSDILILDEPTSVLTPQETKELFSTLRALAEQGKSVIFITHKLKEVFEIADRLTVLRAGRVIGTARPTEMDEASLAAMMVGHEVALQVTKKPASPANVVFKADHVAVKSDSGYLAVEEVSLQIHGGEVLGIAGVEGNGQNELVEALIGLRPMEKGHLWLGEQEVTHAPLRQIRQQGVGIIPEDRQKQGLVLDYSVQNNLILNRYYQPEFNSGLRLRWPQIRTFSQDLVKRFDIRTPGVDVSASNLSGGNQQKIIIARELTNDLRLLIAAQPTRGVDIAAVEFIHQKIIGARDAGCAVLLVSADLDELLALSDRIAVLYRGKIVGEVSSAEATKWMLGRWMLGLEN